MMLVVDAGNTRVKWGVHDGGWRSSGSLRYESLGELETLLHGIDRVVVSCVAGPEAGARLRSMMQPMVKDVLWVRAAEAQCGARNGYDHPERLGSDRWAALVAARRRHPVATVIASAGTALTVDALSAQGAFLGGFILPGLGLMHQSLLAGTAGIGSAQGASVTFPTNTGDAVTSGVLAAMAGAVRQMTGQLGRHEGQTPVLLLTGGDAGLLQTALSGAGEIVDNLVLEGLVLIAEELTG